MPKQMTEEEIEALKEKIKNMSPEELRDFQKKQCIFCHIISGKVQAKKIYEDDKTLAVLDINPANPGHILLLPKEHYSIMPQLPEDELKHIFMVAKSLSNAALKSLEATGTNIVVANGSAAGQKAQHFMVHIIPRKEDDNISFSIPQNKIPENELNIIQKKLFKKMVLITSKSKSSKQGVGIIGKLNSKRNKTRNKEMPDVVEAEFEEASSGKKKKSKTQAKKKSTNKKQSKKLLKKSKKEDINLDDIAGILNIK